MANKKITEKHYDADEVALEAKAILDNYKEKFPHLDHSDIKFLFRTGKNKAGKKHVNIKVVREPMTLVTNTKVIFIVTDEWWNESIGPERTKALIEGLVSLQLDKNGNLKKRSFDVQTYSDFITEEKLDFSNYVKVLPTEAKRENLVLTNGK